MSTQPPTTATTPATAGPSTTATNTAVRPHRRKPSCPWPLLTPDALANDTPSRRAGVPLKSERKFYRNVFAIVRDAGAALHLASPTVTAALLFAFRYFAVRSFSKSDRFVVATASAFLAAKARDELRPLDAVLAACLRVRASAGGGAKAAKGKKVGGGDGDDAGGAPPPSVESLLADPAYMASLRDAVLTAERAILYALGFELDVEPPQEALLRSLALLRQSDDAAVASFWADPKHTQLALNFISDSFRTTLCLTHDWAHIGAGAVAAVVAITGGPPPLVAGGAPFWQVAVDDLTAETLDDVVSVITGMYVTDDGGGGGGGGGGKSKDRTRGAGDAAAPAPSRPSKAAKTAPDADAASAAAAAAAHEATASPASGEAASTPLGDGAGGGPAPAPPPANGAPTTIASVASLEEGELA